MNILNRLFHGWRWLQTQTRKNKRILRTYRRKARKLAKKCPEEAGQVLWLVDEVEEMLKLK